MKNYLSILCVSFFMGMLALSARAVDTPYYVSGNIGASLFSNITLNNPATQIQQGTFPTSASYAVESALGRDFDGFRVEVEAGLQQNKTTRIGAESANFVVESVGIMDQFRFVKILVDLLHHFVAALQSYSDVDDAYFCWNGMCSALFHEPVGAVSANGKYDMVTQECLTG